MDEQHTPDHLPVVVIGAGITGLSLVARLDQLNIPFILLESEDRVGGQIHTLSEKGYTFEVGPNTGSVSHPETTELFEYVSPECKMEVAKEAANSRWIWKGDRFHPLPSGLISGLTTPLFSWKDKFGILLEPFRRRGDDPDESVGELAERRLGKSMVRYAVDPFVGGIYSGDAFMITTKYALPKLYNLEQNYGSFIWGSVRKGFEKKDPRDKKATKKVFSAEGGLENLPKAIAAKASRTGEIITGISDLHIHNERQGLWSITFTTKEGESRKVLTDNVVTTVRADKLEGILPKSFVPELPPIASLVYAPMIEVSVGYDHLPQVKTDAFGGLVPSVEKRKVLGILFPSSCFRNRVPYDDSQLFTLFMGGMRDGHLFKHMSDEEVIKVAMSELRDMMKIPADKEPDMVHITRYRKSIPQYDKGSALRLQRLDEIHHANPGLILAGGISDGIGLSHRIAQGTKVANTIAETYKK